MKNLQVAKNGTVTMQEKLYNELTNQELEKLVFAKGDTKENYETYIVQRNKKNELIRVEPSEYTETYKQELQNDYRKANIIDACNIMFASPSSKVYRQSRKKFTTEETKTLRSLVK